MKLMERSYTAMSFQHAFRLLVLISALFCVHSAYAQREWTGSGSTPAYIRDFVTNDTGYAESYCGLFCPDTLIRTTDGGQTWNAVSLPVPDSSFSGVLTFFGADGWLVIFEPDTSIRLLKSTDYGFTWSVLTIDSSLQPTDILFKSPSLGYLWSNNFTNTFLYITTDSGNTWHKRNLPPAGMYGSNIDAVGSPNVILGENGNGFYLSTDTGLTWNEYNGPSMMYIGANTWITQNTWSTDNGQTWNPAQTTSQPTDQYGVTVTDTLGHGMFIAHFTDASIGEGLLYFTSDYGHSWDSVDVPFPKIGWGEVVGGAWYVVPLSLDSDDWFGPLPLYRSPPAPSSVSQTTLPSTFQILTNPATHVLQISLEEIPDEIRVVDFLGRTVAEYATQGSAFSVDVSALPAGLYWVVTRSGAQPFVHLSE
jgi:photosystem II stability/assembly factor-like uncharacterized protein